MLNKPDQCAQLSDSKPMGTSILFLNASNEILLLLRDNIPQIKYPNMWDIPGGNVEHGETPEECITREIEEEFGVAITDLKLFERRDFSDRVEFTFWQRAFFDIQEIILTEGQKLKWFSEKEVKNLHLAFNFNITVESFFNKTPWNKLPTKR